jgi:peptide/nickel transport system substrate-binding protein
MRRLFAVLGATLLVAVSCGQAEPSTSPTPAAAASEKPVPGGRLVVAQVGDPKTYQPVISTDTTSSGAYGWVYQSLTRGNKDTGEPEGNLAVAAPTVSADGLTLTWTLRDNLQWSDGTPFTGEDYRYTIEAVARSKKTVRKSTIQDIVGFADYRDGKTDQMAGITVSPDGKTIAVKLTKVFCPGIQSLGGTFVGGLLPSAKFKQYWNNKSTDASANIDDNPLNNAPPVSIGPFVWVSATPGTEIRYKANDKYFRGKPFIEELIIKNYADTAAIKAALLTGEVSYAGIQAADYEEVSKSELLKGYRFPGDGYTYIGWNAKAAKAPWLADVKVRQALWQGINVEAIYQKIVFGLAARQYGHIVKRSWGYPGDDQYNKYPYDVAKAKSLLESAGAKMGPDGVYRWTDGKSIAMRIETNSGNKTRETILEIAVEQYKQIGVKIEPVLESFNVLLDRTDPGPDFEGFIIGWAGVGEDPYSIWHSSQQGKSQFNNVGYSNPDVDKALEVNRNGPDCSREARKKQLAISEKALNNDAPYTFLYNQDALLFMNKKIQGTAPAAYSTTHNIEQWWIKQ